MGFRYGSAVERLCAHSVLLTDGPHKGCWHWTGSRNNVGRPRITVRLPGKARAQRITVARFIVQFVHGGAWGRNQSRRRLGAHSCHNADCANPDHVERGTPVSNNRATVKAGRHRHNNNIQKFNEARSNG